MNPSFICRISNCPYSTPINLPCPEKILVARLTIVNKIEQNKARYNLDRQTAKISALSSGNVSKYEFLTGKDVLSEKDLLEKAAAVKRVEYLPSGSKVNLSFLKIK